MRRLTLPRLRIPDPGQAAPGPEPPSVAEVELTVGAGHGAGGLFQQGTQAGKQLGGRYQLGEAGYLFHWSAQGAICPVFQRARARW